MSTSIFKLILASALISISASETIRSLLGIQLLQQVAISLLNTSVQDNLALFALLSAIKGALGVIEGSEVGLSLGASFTLEIGDIIEPACDYIQFVWSIMLKSITWLILVKLLFQTQLPFLGFMIAGVTLTIEALVPKVAPSLSRVTFFCASSTITMYSALFVSNAINSWMIKPMQAQFAESLKISSSQLLTAPLDFGTIRERLSLMRPMESAEGIVTLLKSQAESIASSAEQSLVAALSYCILLIVESAIIPVSLFILLMVVWKRWHWRPASALSE